MPGKLDLDRLSDMVASGEIDTVVAAFTDLQGRLMGKRVTGHFFIDRVIEEWHACDYLLACDIDMEPVPGFEAASWDKGYGDFAVRPDMGTLRLVPWLEGTALVLGDVVDHRGEELPHSPRAVLKRQIARLAEQGLSAKIGSELEFYLFQEDFEQARGLGYRDLTATGWYIEDYHVLQTTKAEPFMRTVRNHMDRAGVPVEFSKGEWGPGQQELNLAYADALEMADRHVIYKNGVKEIAHGQGMAVTFMAKWNAAQAGSSCHIHSSLWHPDGEPAFPDEDAEGGRSALFGQYLAGQLALAAPMTFFLAPFVNSYRRFQPGTFAPTRLVWSGDNRTSGFRVLGHGAGLRVENRVPGADINPYLAFAATIAAGLHGLEQGLAPPPAFEGDAYKGTDVPSVPSTLRDALDLLERSEELRAAMGDEVIDHYVHLGRWEVAQFERQVTDWELTRYFERG
jgi:glutamine synthetase